MTTVCSPVGDLNCEDPLCIVFKGQCARAAKRELYLFTGIMCLMCQTVKLMSANC